MHPGIAGLNNAPEWDSRRLWSLWDMINFQLRSFMEALTHLNIAQMRARNAAPDSVADSEHLTVIHAALAPIQNEAIRLGMPTVIRRLSRITAFFGSSSVGTYDALSREINEVFDAVEHDAAEEFFCHYPRNRIGPLRQLESDWHPVFVSFKSARPEIEAGVDCFALGHNTASVFHMCRVGEIALRAIGRERGVRAVRRGTVPIEWGTWGQVFKAIEPKIEKIRKKPNGHQKDTALAFYDSVLSDLRTIQSLYRDHTMHLRNTYDDGEAQSAMFRVRELMTTLSGKLNETSTRSIPWSAWK